VGLGSGGSEKEQEGENGGRGGERGREGGREWRELRKWRMGRKGRGGAPWRSATAKSEERRWLRAGGVFNEVSEQGDRRRLRWRVAADEMGGVRGGGVRCLVD
jgi:hypothetical protein